MVVAAQRKEMSETILSTLKEGDAEKLHLKSNYSSASISPPQTGKSETNAGKHQLSLDSLFGADYSQTPHICSLVTKIQPDSPDSIEKIQNNEHNMKQEKIEENNEDPMDPLQKLKEGRKKWGVGQAVSVYSNSAMKWHPGTIVATESQENPNSIEVYFSADTGENMSKYLDRFSSEILYRTETGNSEENIFQGHTEDNKLFKADNVFDFSVFDDIFSIKDLDNTGIKSTSESTKKTNNKGSSIQFSSANLKTKRTEKKKSVMKNDPRQSFLEPSDNVIFNLANDVNIGSLEDLDRSINEIDSFLAESWNENHDDDFHFDHRYSKHLDQLNLSPLSYINPPELVNDKKNRENNMQRQKSDSDRHDKTNSIQFKLEDKQIVNKFKPSFIAESGKKKIESTDDSFMICENGYSQIHAFETDGTSELRPNPTSIDVKSSTMINIDLDSNIGKSRNPTIPSTNYKKVGPYSQKRKRKSPQVVEVKRKPSPNIKKHRNNKLKRSKYVLKSGFTFNDRSSKIKSKSPKRRRNFTKSSKKLRTNQNNNKTKKYEQISFSLEDLKKKGRKNFTRSPKLKSRKNRNNRTKKPGFMKPTKSSLSRLNQNEDGVHPVAIVQLVSHGRHVGQINVCQGDNAFELADKFIKSKRNMNRKIVSPAQRNDLAKLLMCHLEQFCE